MDLKNQKQPLKKMIPQLLISVSLFSFLVSYSSLYNSSSSPSSSSSLVYPAGSLKFHHYFSANKNSFQLNKNCLFLICNGLLVFLAKTSGLIQPPAANDVLVGDAFGASLEKFVPEEEEETARSDDPAGGGGGKIASAADGLEEVSIFIAESEEEEGGNGGAAANDDAGKDENQPGSTRSCWLFDEDGDQQLYGPEANEYEHEHEHEHEHEDEDEDGEEMSTEELNRKFEEFIRKMKEDIIVNEARQKSLMLN